MRMLGDRVLVRPHDQQEMTDGGIILPDVAKGQPERGTVVAVGPGSFVDGQRLVPDVTPCDVVLFPKVEYRSVVEDGVKHFIIHESDLLAVL